MQYRPILPIAWFAVCSVLMVFLTPPFEAPDEPSHLNYVNFISTRLALPNQQIASDAVQGEGAQPPLYYAAAASVVRTFLEDNRIDYTLQVAAKPLDSNRSGKRPLLYKHDKSPFAGQSDLILFYILRLLTVCVSVCTMVAIRRVLEEIFSQSDIRTIGLWYVATLPQFAFISGVVNSDAPALLFATLTLLWTIRLYRDPVDWRNHLMAGAMFGLGLMVKVFGIVAAPTIAVAYFLILFEKRFSFVFLLKKLAGLLSMTILFGSFHYVRAIVLYNDPLMTKVINETNNSQGLLHSPLQFDFWWPMIPRSFISSIATFGWMNNSLPIWAYIPHLLLFFAALLGCWQWFRSGKLPAVLLLPLVLFLGNALGVLYWNARFDQPQGRYYFPSLAFFASVIGVGLVYFAQNLKHYVPQTKVLAICIGMFVSVELFSLVWMVTSI